MTSDRFPSLKPDEYWDELGDDVFPGDLFLDVPLLSRETAPLITDDEWRRGRLYLPTVIEPAILFREFLDNWWFLPVVTAAGFVESAVYEQLLSKVMERDVRGWFPLPPLEAAVPALSRPALVYLRRPTSHQPALIERLGCGRVASLKPEALARLNADFAWSLD